jgi:two-component system, NarL family, invasion response regulator UvrY
MIATDTYKILIVDDHAVVRRGVHEMMREEFPDAYFAEAASATEALQLAGKESFDLILLDVTMPGRSGLDILRDLRLSHPSTAVLVQSMHGEEQFASRVMKAGASGYITKQSLPQELIRAARKVLAGGKYVSESFAEKLAESFADHDRPAHETLSEREFQVLQKLAAGASVKEIGAQLSLSIKTVSTYRSRLLEKLDLGSNAELARYAVREGFLE